MKLILLLLALIFPVPATAEYERSYLSCEDYEWLLEGVERTDMKESIKAEVRLELMLATDPTCFDSQDAKGN